MHLIMVIFGGRSLPTAIMTRKHFLDCEEEKPIGFLFHIPSPHFSVRFRCSLPGSPTAAAPSKAPLWSSARPAGTVTMSACPRPSPSALAATIAPRARTWPRKTCARPARTVRLAPIAQCPRARAAIIVRLLVWADAPGLLLN